MTKKMLIDATHDEETRVAIVEGNRLLEFDYESKFRKALKGSIFLAKVTRVEPSLQAAFVNFGGNRHGFLPFSEIHPDYFRIPIADREALIAEQQAALEELDKQEDVFQGSESGDRTDLEEEQGDSEGSETLNTIEEIAEDGIGEIEEIGGKDPGLAVDDYEAEGQPYVDVAPQEDLPRSSEEEDSFTEDAESLSGEARNDEGSQPNGDRQESGYGRNDRFQRRGRRGGGRGRHGRMSHNSRQVESFGGEEYEDSGDRFRFNLRRKYNIQEVIKRGQIMLVQVSKEERGNKGAAVSTYLSLPGRYCVLMPNSPRGGGVSRKIASHKDRARMREIVRDLEVPPGMSVIVRTAGVARTKAEIKRDLDYLMRLWDNIRELTLQSTAPAMVYEEADLIKRAVRDLYGRDIEEVIVSGEEGFKTARNFMKMLVPSHTKRVIEYSAEDVPLFNKFHVEEQIAEIGEAQVTLPSGGYLVINQTEALVAIDVNSGKATKERHIEETALKTNMEAAHEVARQLRLRDLGGLVVVDFIDMEDRRNNARVERKMRDALSTDRARIQMGRISSFGLMELSRQRLNPSLNESQFELCQHCKGIGRVRTCDATSIMVLRALEDEGIRHRFNHVIAHVSNDVALYILNNKRKNLSLIENRYGFNVLIRVDDTVGASSFRIEGMKSAEQQDDGQEERYELERPAATSQGSERQREERSEEHPKQGRDDYSQGKRRGRRGGRRRNGREDYRDKNIAADGSVESGYQEADEETRSVSGNEVTLDISDEDDTRGNREHFGASSGNDYLNKRSRPASDNRNGPKRRHPGSRDNFRRGNSRGGADTMTATRQRNDSGYTGTALPFESESKPERSSKPQPEPEPVERNFAAAEKKHISAASPEEQVSNHARAFEKVNEPPKEKKRGWWSRGGD